MTEKHRPNEKYKLSRPDNGKDPYGEDQLVFHYDRQRRLEKAPDAVKALYAAPEKKRRFGFFRSLVGDRPRRMLFFVIIMMCLLIFILSTLGKFDNLYSLEGNKIEAEASIYEGSSIIVLTKTIETGEDTEDTYYGAVDIAVSPVSQNTASSNIEDYSVFYHRIFFNPENEESYRFVVPFDTPELLMVLQTERNELSLKIKPKPE